MISSSQLVSRLYHPNHKHSVKWNNVNQDAENKLTSVFDMKTCLAQVVDHAYYMV